ncbi:MAG: RNA polymerase-binding transcription factor CarD [candidate division WS6 bacterium OLB20]|uniref:RNA polymerase-binding transcription factor CarD n=1 Tax=candidate division WS6 bacterium OLB20 TaxID=1617426 RepID=A0A136LX01_9BACT|nr:MAG: RNA polymerase-binding transcription factor CarD [candidate division WS6 bacterium OLB20]
MFKKGDTIMYPVYGPGVITEITQESFGEEDKQYFHIDFEHRNLSISIPVETADNFGMRVPLSKKEIRDALSELERSVRITDKLIETLDEELDQRIKSGDIEDAIWVVSTLRAYERKRQKDDKRLGTIHQDYLEKAMNYLHSEILLVLGEKFARPFAIE